ncbi:Hypothetical predicted protein [Octopus vulgaris]|nr:Hypothetical predicted protein [Octopus vulgaris]
MFVFGNIRCIAVHSHRDNGAFAKGTLEETTCNYHVHIPLFLHQTSDVKQHSDDTTHTGENDG